MAKKLLVVDDDPSIREVLTFLFQKEGFEVFTASTGEQAVVEVNRSEFDLVLLDLMLTGISGIEVANRIQIRKPNVKIVIITAYPGRVESTIRGMIKSGVILDVVTKPFSPKELVAKVRKFLGMEVSPGSETHT